MNKPTPQLIQRMQNGKFNTENFTDGEKVEVTVEVCYVGSFAGAYGFTHICQMIDDEGNRFKYMGSALKDDLAEVGARVTIKGTIKHKTNYRNEELEVLVQRIKVVAVHNQVES